MKTKEQSRGKILAARLTLLNDFLQNEKNTGIAFGEYLKDLGLTEREFLAQLPDDLNLPGLVSAKAESNNLLGYAKAMNLVYYNQFLKHLDKGGKYHSFDADAQDLSAAVIQEGDDFHYAKGRIKGIIKNVANTIKTEVKTVTVKVKEVVKDPKAAIQSAIDKTKDAIKSTTNKLKDKAKELGAKIKKQGLIGTANKFNPVMVAMRGAFLGLVLINAFNLAKNLARVKAEGGTNWAKFVKKFKVMGGSEDVLNKQISKAKDKPKPAAKLKAMIGGRKGADGEYHNVEPTTTSIAATITAAMPLVLLAVDTVKKFKKAKGEPEGEDEETGLAEGEIDPNNLLDTDTKDAAKDIESDELVDDAGFFAKFKVPIFVTGGLVLATAIGLIIKSVMGKK